AVDGVAWWRRSVEKVPVPSGDDVYVLFREAPLHTFIRWVGEVLSSKTHELKKPHVAAAMHATFAANETEARKFWKEVSRGGDEFDDSAPSAVLDRWLQDLRTDKPGKSAKNYVGPGELYQGCVFGWRAYREGKRIREIRYDLKHGWYPVVS